MYLQETEKSRLIKHIRSLTLGNAWVRCVLRSSLRMTSKPRSVRKKHARAATMAT